MSLGVSEVAGAFIGRLPVDVSSGPPWAHRCGPPRQELIMRAARFF
jgi:hypothetical protein